MERFFLEIKDIIFRLQTDADIEAQISKRAELTNNGSFQSNYDVDIICKKEEKIIFTNRKFINQQEPDISNEYYYREIFDLGIFKYCRKQKKIYISYIDQSGYPFNSFEVVADTIFQFIYLVMLEFEIIPLHASVISYKKNAILLFGNSGSGKTTLELSLLNSGFSFFSDDIAFLDDQNQIYNSGERIVAYSKKTKEVIIESFGKTFLDEEEANIANKQIARIAKTMISEYKELTPCFIIFPSSRINDEICKKIDKKSLLIKLIELTISEQFSISQKKLYMQRLKHLSEKTPAFEYNWSSEKNSLHQVCLYIKNICEEEIKENF